MLLRTRKEIVWYPAGILEVSNLSAKMAHHENVEMFPRFGFFEMNNTGEGYDFYIY